jgi:hypothetical protein
MHERALTIQICFCVEPYNCQSLVYRPRPGFDTRTLGPMASTLPLDDGGRQTDYLLPSSVEVQNTCGALSPHPIALHTFMN